MELWSLCDEVFLAANPVNNDRNDDQTNHTADKQGLECIDTTG